MFDVLAGNFKWRRCLRKGQPCACHRGRSSQVCICSSSSSSYPTDIIIALSQEDPVENTHMAIVSAFEVLESYELGKGGLATVYAFTDGLGRSKAFKLSNTSLQVLNGQVSYNVMKI